MLISYKCNKSPTFGHKSMPSACMWILKEYHVSGFLISSLSGETRNSVEMARLAEPDLCVSGRAGINSISRDTNMYFYLSCSI